MPARNTLIRALEFYGLHMNHPGNWRVHAWLRRVLNIHVDQELEVLRGGLLWKLNPSDFMASNLFWLGKNDTWLLYHALKFLRPGDVIFDVGANFGYYSCKFAQALKGNCSVFAFEPFPSTFARLAGNVDRNGFGNCVRMQALALCDKVGHGSMTGVDGNSGAAYVTQGVGSVSLSTIDQVCADYSVDRLAFIKLDVEGCELAVFRGAEKTLRKHKPVLLVEVNPVTLQRAGHVAGELINEIKGYGYDLFEVRRKKLIPISGIPHGDDHVDVFCIHSGTVARWKQSSAGWITEERSSALTEIKKPFTGTRALVTSCNLAFVAGAEALLRSAARFHPDIERYCFVPQEELIELQNRLGSMAHVRAYPDIVKGIPKGNMANVGRLFVTVPDVDVAVYIDADAHLCAPCDRLWEVEPGRVNVVADSSTCVADNMANANRQTFIRKHPEIALVKGFNAGIIGLRKQDWPDLTASFERIVLEGGYSYDYVLDQPILNVVFAHHVNFLPFEYNAHGLWDNRIPKHVKVIHYTGRCKPWKKEFPRHEPTYWYWLKYGQVGVPEYTLVWVRLWALVNWPKRVIGRYLRRRYDD